MKFFFEQPDMLKVIQKVQKAIPTRTPIDILKGIYLHLKGDILTLTATDLELGIQTLIHVRGMEDGSIIIPERFVEIVKSLPPGEIEMSLDQENYVAQIKFEDIIFHVNGFSTEEFPAFPEKSQAESDATFPGSLLRMMLHKTLFTVSTDQSKPAFTGVNFILDENKLRLTASDTFRLVVIEETIKNMAVSPPREFIVPAKSLRELERIVKEDDMVQMYVVQGLAIFTFGETTLASSLLGEQFPNISRVIPKDDLTRVTVNKNILEMALGRASLLADSDIHTITMDTTAQSIQIHSVSSLGQNKERVPLKSFTGEEVTIIINIRFLNEVLKVISDTELSLHFKGESGPCIIRIPSKKDFLYLALPIKPE